MIKNKNFSFLLLLLVLSFAACKHEIPQPTAEVGGNGGGGGSTEPPCDPSVIYFEQQVLPLIQSSCAVPDCHDSFSGEPEFAMTNYDQLLNNSEEDDLIIPGNPSESEVIDVIIDGEMPPAGYSDITQEQLDILITWIEQGAPNNSCEDLYCDTTLVTFSGTILPLIENRCQGCHSGSDPQGSLALLDYDDINTIALNGSFWGAVNHESPYTSMPYQADQLPQCNLDQIRIWIEDGAPNN
jgi:mono/diheme cytochrome c family protein